MLLEREDGPEGGRIEFLVRLKALTVLETNRDGPATTAQHATAAPERHTLGFTSACTNLSDSHS